MANPMHQLAAANLAEITQLRTEIVLIKQQRILEKTALREMAKAIISLRKILEKEGIGGSSDLQVNEAIFSAIL